MKLHGLQKMTLLDFPGHVACTVFLGGCDFRCPFCHNYELADGTAKPVMEEEEFFAFLEKRNGLLDGVAITGGEPCLQKELPAFLQKIKSRGFLTKLDTNGTHPQLLRQILEEGLADYVAMDIKNSPARYAETAGLRFAESMAEPSDRVLDQKTAKEQEVLAAVRESVALLLQGKAAYEFRTTVVKEFHTEADFEEIGRWIAGAQAYYLQCFTDRDSVPYGNLHAPSVEELEEYRRIVSQYVNNVELRGV
ncbi:MAG: anaerobic ribonucleoside-triphosphate reductase activating protein [Eubacterium sp.]|nr:anaerobic ribonucleoside-triphosphate reductase activating protein [Eubacterium sp.]